MSIVFCSKQQPSAETACRENMPILAQPTPPCANYKRTHPSSSPLDGPMRQGKYSLIPVTTRRRAAVCPAWRNSPPSAIAPTIGYLSRRLFVQWLAIDGSPRYRGG